MAEPISFAFIMDEELRASLESDHAELRACLASSSWKAAHVMSGAIIEAVLVDYLITAAYSKKDPLTMTLEDLISAGKSEGALSTKAADLSTVIRGYRNLIHPGRVVRLKETVDEEGAAVAHALVSMVVREVSVEQAQQFGLTAEQLLTKFENDPTVFAIADHLLREAQPHQLERLLLSIAPDRYFILAETEFFSEGQLDAMNRVARLYIAAYEAAPPEIQKKAAKRFVAILREDSGYRVETHEEHFFRGFFLEHLTDAEQRLVKDHLFSRLQGSGAIRLIAAVDGLSAHIKPNDVLKLFDPLIRVVSYSDAEEERREASDRLESEYFQWLPAAPSERLRTRLDEWVAFHFEKDRPDAAERITAVRARLGPADDDIPF